MEFRSILFGILAFSTMVAVGCQSAQKPKKKDVYQSEQGDSPNQQLSIYVFSKTAGYRHDNIPLACGLMKKMADAKGWAISYTEDAELIRSERLTGLDVLVFLNTTGDVLEPAQEAAMEQYIKSGGGFLGIHAAADTEYDWPFYQELVGAYFKNHPSDPGVREATSRNVAIDHPVSKDLPKDWTRMDEWYNYKDYQDHIIPLYNLDETSYEGGENGAQHPIAWCHEKLGGRAVYTGMGHTKESFSEPEFMKFLENAIEWIAER